MQVLCTTPTAYFLHVCAMSALTFCPLSCVIFLRCKQIQAEQLLLSLTPHRYYCIKMALLHIEKDDIDGISLPVRFAGSKKRTERNKKNRH